MGKYRANPAADGPRSRLKQFADYVNHKGKRMPDSIRRLNRGTQYISRHSQEEQLMSGLLTPSLSEEKEVKHPTTIENEIFHKTTCTTAG